MLFEMSVTEIITIGVALSYAIYIFWVVLNDD